MNSQALDYFPFNVDFFEDDKIQLIEGEFGERGGYLAVRLLCKIYSTGGYYYQWGEDECLLLTRRLGSSYTIEEVDKIVRALVKRGVFDKAIFEERGILTSRGIQNRYFEGAKKRKSVKVERDLLLVDVSNFKNVSLFDKKGDFFGEKGDFFQQSKVKESKVKESNSFLPLPSSPAVEEVGQEKESEKEKIIYFFTFERNWAAPNEEYGKFVEFNHDKWPKLSTEKREEYVKGWQQQPERVPRFPEPFLKTWKQLFDSVFSRAPEDVRAEALSDQIGCKYGRGVLYLSCSSKLKDYIESQMDCVKPILWPYMQSINCRLLNYDVKN